MINTKKITSITSGESYLFVVDKTAIADKVVSTILSKFKIRQEDFIAIQKEESAISITDVRKTKRKILLKPAGKFSLFSIYKAQNMTPEAQNAILKILEEPPKYLIIVLFVDNTAKLIPTIISRCKKIILRSGLEKTVNKEYIILLHQLTKEEKIYKQFLIIDKILKTDVDLLKILKGWILYLKSKPEAKNIKLVVKIDRFARIYNKSLNKKLYLENLVLNIR